jgi:hypothetical protein
VHAVWFDYRDSNYEIYYKRSTDGGTNWEADKRLTNDAAFSLYPSIAVSGSFVHVVWQEKRDGNDEIYYKNSNDGGVNWNIDKRLTNDTNGSYSPSIAVSGSFVHIVWYDLRGGGKTYRIYYKRSIDKGSAWEADLHLNSSTGAYMPSIEASDSFVFIVWSLGSIYPYYFKSSKNGGASWTSESILSPNNSRYSSVAVSGKYVHVVWEDNRSGNFDIYYKCSINGGISWGIDTLLSDNMATASEYPSIALSGSVVHIVWKDKRDGPNGEIYYKRNPTGNLVSGVDDLKITQSILNVYPNPFSGYANIEFECINSGSIEIDIFDQTGKLIQTLKCENCQAGRNTMRWNCSDKNNNRVQNGVYYCKVNLGNDILVKKMIVVK